MNWEEYFNELKSKRMSSIINTIDNVEKSLEKHKKELEALKNTKFESLELN